MSASGMTKRSSFFSRKAGRKAVQSKQLDFWPDRRNRASVALSHLSTTAALPPSSTRSAHEDDAGRKPCGEVATRQGERLGIPALNPDSFCTSQEEWGGKDV